MPVNITAGSATEEVVLFQPLFLFLPTKDLWSTAEPLLISKAQNSQVLLELSLYEIPPVQQVIAFILTASLQILLSPDNEATFSITCKALFKYPGVHISGIRLYTALSPWFNSTFPAIKKYFNISTWTLES